MPKKFQKRVEDFVCEHCNNPVKGNGFTNHCPKCIWGKHVDINPGDRKSECGGMMEPIRVEKKGPKFHVVHKCIKCGLLKQNVVSPEDDFDVLVTIAKKSAEKEFNKND